jgi:Mn2+/Fe2+ NRAMP family transporter
LNYSAYVHEKGWRTPEKMRMQRWDLAASLFGMLVMLLLIQTAAAGALRPRGLQVARVEDLIPIFSTVLGEGGAVLLGLLLWGVLFSSHVTGTVGNALMMTDVWYRFIRRTDGGAAAGHASERPFYRWAIVYMCLSPLYVFATEWTPVGLVLAYGVISILALPVIAGLICWLTADRRVMGEHRNGWLTNAALGFTVLAAVYLCWEGIGDVLRSR